MRWLPTVALLLFGWTVSAEMIGPTQIPATRVIKNLEAKIAQNPKDAQVEYMLGRTYYALFCSTDPRVIALYGSQAGYAFPSKHTSVWEFKTLKPQSDPKAIGHAKNALKHLQIAARMGGGEPGLYQLTLACAYEATSGSASLVQRGASPEVFLQRALAAYEASFREAQIVDRKREYQKEPLTWENWISIEASDGILRLNPDSHLKSAIEAHRAVIEKLPPGPITPLIFSLSKPTSLEDLLDSSRVVNFDLDGTGALQRYSWVKGETAFLVWQPDARTPIRSGRQLFGSATWWLMPSNAYAALELLDDNGDEWLTGDELRSLAVWRDANQNGTAEPREVVKLGSVGVIGLNTKSKGRIGDSYFNDGGLRVSDGRILPTYDWVTRAITVPKSGKQPVR